jgi:hypothetical protein
MSNDDERRYAECRAAAIRDGALQPQGFKESLAANWLSYEGKSFADTALAQERLRQMIEERMRRQS